MMREYDLVIRGGTIVEGTGIPRYRADLAVKDGRIAMISGKIKAGGAKELDASGCVVAPGAIDLHCHFDAQLNWDPYCSLNGWMGITSLTIGLCGFGFAPTRPEDRERAMRIMNRVEAIPLESMRQGMRWDWITFPEYLDSLDGQGLGVNVASLFPFNPIRGWVLGMLPARERTSVTEAELNQMKQMFYEGMKAGAFGFSGNQSQEDRNEAGGPLPSHVASEEEWLGLAEVLSEFGIGHIGWSTDLDHPERSRELLTKLLRVSGRPVHTGAKSEEASVAWMEDTRREGLPLITQESVRPGGVSIFKITEYNMFDQAGESWIYPFVGTAEERAAKLRKPEVRAAMKRVAEERPKDQRLNYDTGRVVETAYDRNRQYEGMTFAEIGQSMGKHPLDAWLDLALDEGLQTTFQIRLSSRTSEEEYIKGIKNPYSHISLSDGGAHIRFQTSAIWPIFFLSHWVRDKELMSLEDGAYKMSAYPAWIAGFRDRGMLRIGSWADIIVYNLEELGFVYDRHVWANDFPGGEKRVIQKPTGLRYTIVNGTVTFEGNDCTGALPGKLLRSYEMID